MRFPTIWYVWQAKVHISLHIHTVWSEPLLVAWIFYDCSATDQTLFGVSKLKRRLPRLAWVYSWQNATFWKSHLTVQLCQLVACCLIFNNILLSTFFSNWKFQINCSWLLSEYQTFWIQSGLTFCLAWSRSKLFAKIIRWLSHIGERVKTTLHGWKFSGLSLNSGFWGRLSID